MTLASKRNIKKLLVCSYFVFMISTSVVPVSISVWKQIGNCLKENPSVALCGVGYIAVISSVIIHNKEGANRSGLSAMIDVENPQSPISAQVDGKTGRLIGVGLSSALTEYPVRASLHSKINKNNQEAIRLAQAEDCLQRIRNSPILCESLQRYVEKHGGSLEAAAQAYVLNANGERRHFNELVSNIENTTKLYYAVRSSRVFVGMLGVIACGSAIAARVFYFQK